MEEKRDFLVYDHFILPVKLHYYGYTGKDIHTRKTKGNYKRTTLQFYLNQYGWDNINTTIVTEGLTKKEAELLEDKLIKEGWERGDCINKQGSGGESRDNPKEYRKTIDKKRNKTQHRQKYRKQYNAQYYQEHKEKMLEHSKQYQKEHNEELKIKRFQYIQNNKERIKEKGVEYYQTNKDEIRKKQKQYFSTNEGKIYMRVKNYNRYYPDRKLITPLEAKEMYILTGYIPNFIKNDDLL